MYTPNATISEIVQDALTTGYLTTLAENQLRQLLQTRYTHTDFQAFMALQYAALAGRVKQQSREPIALQQSVGTLRFTRKISPSPVGEGLG